jgi:glycosyltransferase involved in cell wall biosynthesis
MRRILSIVHIPGFGGPHNQVLRLAPMLAQQGWETIMLIPDEPGTAAARITDAGVPLLQIPLHRLRARPDIRLQRDFVLGFGPEVAHIRHIIRQQHIDLVQIGGLMNPHGAIAARLENIPVVWQLLGTTAPMALRRGLMPLVLRLADVVMTTGTRVARLHPGALTLGDRLVPFFPPVDAKRFVFDPGRRATARAQLRVSPDSLLVGTVGNFNRLKGHDIMIRAAALLHQRSPHIMTRILGAPTTHASYYEQEVKAEAQARGLLANERLAFFDPADKVADFLPAFDVFVLSSRQEGVPTVILEAMATSLPVVATDVGGVREVVEHGSTGFLVAPGDAPAIDRAAGKLIEWPALRHQMGQIARQRVLERYDLEICAAQHIRAYTRALAHHQARQHRSEAET